MVFVGCLVNCCLCKDFSAELDEVAAREIDGSINTSKKLTAFRLKIDREEAAMTEFEASLQRIRKHGRKCCCCCRDHNRCQFTTQISKPHRRHCFYLYGVFLMILIALLILMLTLDERIVSAVEKLPSVIGKVSTFVGTNLVNALAPLIIGLDAVLLHLNSTLVQATHCYRVDAVINSSEFTEATEWVEASQGNIAVASDVLNKSTVLDGLSTQTAVARTQLNITATNLVGTLQRLAETIDSARDDLEQSVTEFSSLAQIAIWLFFGLFLSGLGLFALCIGWADGLYGEVRAR